MSGTALAVREDYGSELERIRSRRDARRAERLVDGTGGGVVQTGSVRAPKSWLERALRPLAPSTYSADVAVEFPAVSAAVRLVSRELGRMKVVVEERQADRWREVDAYVDPEAAIVARQWGAYRPKTKSLVLLARSLMLWGYAAVWIERDPQLRGLRVLDPSAVERSIVRVAGRELVVQYHYSGIDELPVVLDRRDLAWVDFDPPLDGVSTRAPLEAVWPSFRMAVAAARYGAFHFDRGATGNVMFSPKDAPPTAADALLSEDVWEEEDRMRSQGRTSFSMPANLQATVLSVDPRHSQLLELLNYGVQDVARTFGLTPMALQELTHGSYSNYGQSLRFMARFTLTNLAHYIADELSAMLWPSGFRRVRLAVADLGDESLLERAQRLKIEKEAGLISPNEGRMDSNRDPVGPVGPPTGEDMNVVRGAAPFGGSDMSVDTETRERARAEGT